jgi:hypothetical protein
LQKYVGEYKFQYPETRQVISFENGKLMMLEPGFPKAELFAESETGFFLKSADVQLRFVKDENGAVTGVTVYQGDSTLYEMMEGQKIKYR